MNCNSTVLHPSGTWRGVKMLVERLEIRLARMEGGLEVLGLMSCQFCGEWHQKGKKHIWADCDGAGVCVECLGKWYESSEDFSAHDFGETLFRLFNIVATLPKTRRNTEPLKSICEYHGVEWRAALERVCGR